MIKVKLSFDDYCDRMLKIMAFETGRSRSAIIRSLIYDKVRENPELIKSYADYMKRKEA
ncbi:hypothetical protein D3C87_1057340 [compost metagenome]